MKKNSNKFKVGQTITMLFDMFGIVSEEKHKIIKINGDIVTLDTNEDVTRCFKFHASTGACINDENWGGAKRSLKIK